MKKILLPTDFSDISMNAINYALSLYATVPAEFYFLNVYRVPYLTNEELMENDVQQLAIIESELSAASQNALIETLQKVEKKDIHKFHHISDYNFLISSVKNIVSDKKIDLVVMGTKGATGAKEIFLGSNTGDVLMKTDCNVIAVPEESGFKEINEIVFPTDFKIKYELDTLKPLIDLAKLNNSKIRILHLSDSYLLDQDKENNKRVLESYFDEIEYSYHTLSNIDFEDALNCFIQSRGNIDMIAIIAGHYNFFQRLFFRPKVMELSFHSKVPLFVLHQINQK